MLLSVVIPTYNEAASLGELLPRLKQALDGIDSEVLIVDDDSDDGTAAVARRHGAKAIVRRGERGLGTAVVRGLREAKGTYVAVMDGDLQHPPEVVPRLLEKALQTGAGLVVGSRYAPEGGESFGAGRRAVSEGARLLSRMALPAVRKARLTDPMSGLFLVRRDLVDVDRLAPRGYKVLLDILGRCDVGRIEEVGYSFGRRLGGQSKMSPRVIGLYLVHLATLAWHQPENQRMLRFGLVGLTGVVVNLGLLYLLTDVVGLYYLVSAAFSVEASIISNFLLNDRFTFHDRRRGHRLARLLRFNTVSLVALVVNLTVLYLLTSGLGIHYLASEAVAIVVGFALNYAGNLHWTYGGLDRFRARDAMRRTLPWMPFLVVVLGFAWMASHDLDNPDDIYFDEHYYLSVAYQYNAGTIEDPCWIGDAKLDHRPLNFEHPPLAKRIIAWSVSQAGDDVPVFPGCREPDSDEYAAFTTALRQSDSQVAWRAPSVVFGVVTVLFAGLAAARLTGSPYAAALASWFVATDGIVLTSSRMAILDIFATGFVVVAVWAATHPGRRGIYGAALALAFAFACKFTAVFAGLGVLLLVLWTQRRAGTYTRSRFWEALAAFLVLPLVVLAWSYGPWWRLWTDLHGPAWAIGHWFQVVAAAVGWAGSVQSDHPYASPPWRWILGDRPVFYYAMWNVGGVANMNRYVYGVGNLATWWAAAVAVLIAIGRGIHGVVWKGAKPGPFLLAAVVAATTYVGFMALPREMFLFYMTLIVPLLAIALAVGLQALWRADRWVGIGVAASVALLSALVLAWYYPVLTAGTIHAERFQDIMHLVPWMRR